jgi:SM-20-related protein
MSVRYFDNVLPQHAHSQVFDLLYGPGWQFGWKSHTNRDMFSFWHKQFAGTLKPDHDGTKQFNCATELGQRSPLLFEFWRHLSGTILKGHTIVRCYANAYPYGSEGTLHTDSINPNSYTAVYYPNPRWSPNWGGETVIFNREENEIVSCVYPKPNRLLVFNGMMPHIARGVSRTCPVLRITLMFKTQWSPPATKHSSESAQKALSTAAATSTAT